MSRTHTHTRVSKSIKKELDAIYGSIRGGVSTGFDDYRDFRRQVNEARSRMTGEGEFDLSKLLNW